jgi:glycosyltransferase involved in cell wall biosynthesis
VVISADPALREVAGDAAAPSIEAALGDRERYVRAGLARAKAFTWEETARRTADVYRAVMR